MKFVVIDIETTGVDSDNNQIIELGAVIEDTNKILPIEQLPKFKNIVKHDSYTGSAFAINMNKRIFELLANAEGIRNESDRVKFEKENNIYTLDEVVKNFAQWIRDNYYDDGIPELLNIAGKNFGVFDKLFLEKNECWNYFIKYDRRFIDPAILFVDWKNDKRLPGLNDCLKRAGINKQVSHDATEDCIDTLMCIRNKY